MPVTFLLGSGHGKERRGEYLERDSISTKGFKLIFLPTEPYQYRSWKAKSSISLNSAKHRHPQGKGNKYMRVHPLRVTVDPCGGVVTDIPMLCPGQQLLMGSHWNGPMLDISLRYSIQAHPRPFWRFLT